MSESKPHFSLLPLPLTRAVALVVTFCLLVGDPGWASGVADFARASFSSDLVDLSIPAKLGTITDQWHAQRTDGSTSVRVYGSTGQHTGVSEIRRSEGSNPRPFVVLIQDLHANIGVQKNIASVIDHLYDRYHVERILTEAGFTTADVSLLRSYSSHRVEYQVEERLLRQALLSGVELAAARAGQGRLSPMRLEGVDDPMLYLANVQAFRDLVKVGPGAAREWKSLRDLLMPGAAPELRHHLELTEKLLELKLLDDEWLEYNEHRNLTPHSSPVLNAAIAAGERFYRAAEARNSAMAANVLTRTEDGAPSVLVTGGFHTASIAHELKVHHISFAVVTPTVDRLDQDDLYTRSMVEPPHETVAALVASFPIQTIVTLANQLGDGRSTLWAKARLHVSNGVKWDHKPIAPHQSLWARFQILWDRFMNVIDPPTSGLEFAPAAPSLDHIPNPKSESDHLSFFSKLTPSYMKAAGSAAWNSFRGRAPPTLSKIAIPVAVIIATLAILQVGAASGIPLATGVVAKYVVPVFIASGVAVIHSATTSALRRWKGHDARSLPSVFIWSSKEQIQKRVYAEFGLNTLSDEEFEKLTGRSRAELDQLKRANWAYLYDHLRTLDRAAYDQRLNEEQHGEAAKQLRQEKPVAVLDRFEKARLIEVPDWYRHKSFDQSLTGVARRIGWTMVLGVHLSYIVLHMFFFKFYEAPMAYEWFNDGQVSVGDPDRVAVVLSQALDDSISQAKFNQSLWTVRYFLDKTVIIQSTAIFLSRRLYLALLHGVLHAVSLPISFYAMSVGLTFSAMWGGYFRYYASRDGQLNLFMPGWQAADAQWSSIDPSVALADLNPDALAAFTSHLNVTPEQARLIAKRLRQMQRRGLFNPSILGFWPFSNRFDEARIEQALRDFEYRYNYHESLTPAYEALRIRSDNADRSWLVKRKLSYGAKALGQVAWTVFTFGLKGRWVKDDRLKNLHFANIRNIALGVMGMAWTTGEVFLLTQAVGDVPVNGPTWFNRVLDRSHLNLGERVPLVKAIVNSSERYALGWGSDILGHYFPSLTGHRPTDPSSPQVPNKVPGGPALPETPIELIPGHSDKLSEDALANLKAAQQSAADLKQSLAAKQQAEQDRVSTINGLHAQLDSMQHLFKSELGSPEVKILDKAAARLDATHPDRFIQTLEAARAALVARTHSENAGAIPALLDSLNQFATKLQDARRLVDSLKSKKEANGAVHLTPEEARQLVDALDTLDLASVREGTLRSQLHDLASALDLFQTQATVDGQDPTGRGVAALQTMMNQNLTPAFDSIRALSASLKNLENVDMRHQEEQRVLKYQAEVIAETKASFQGASYQPLSAEERTAMAGQLDRSLYRLPTAEVLSQLDALIGTVAPQSSWGKSLALARAAIKRFGEASSAVADSSKSPKDYVGVLSDAAAAIGRLQRARAAFYENNPNYDPSGLPTDPDLLPHTRVGDSSISAYDQYQRFKSKLLNAHPELGSLNDQPDLQKTNPQAYAKEVDRRLLGRFYAQLIDDTMSSATLDRGMAALQEVIDLSDNRLSLDTQAARADANAVRLIDEQNSLADQMNQVKIQEQALAKQEKTLDHKISLAQKNSDGFVLKEKVTLGVEESQHYGESIDHILAMLDDTKESTDGKSHRLTAAQQTVRENNFADLKAILTQLKTSSQSGQVVDKDGKSVRQLDADQSAAFYRDLTNVLQKLPLLTDPRYLNTGKDNHPDKDTVQALHDFFLQTAVLSAREMAGIPQDRIEQIMSGKESQVNQVVTSIPGIAQAPQSAILTRAQAKQISRDSGVSFNDVVQVLEVVLGASNLRSNFNLARNKPVVYSGYVYTSLQVKRTSDFDLGVGAVEGYRAINGVLDNSSKVLFGARTAFAIRLDHHVFGGLTWRQPRADDSTAVTPGVRLYHRINANGDVKKNGSKTLLWVADNPNIKADHITSSKSWLAVPAGVSDDLSDQFYTVINGQKYVWQGDKAPFREHIPEIRNAAEASLYATEFIRSYKSGFARHYIRLGDPLTRITSGLNVIGAAIAADQLIKNLHFKAVVHHRGGFVSVEQAPVELARFELTNSKNQPFTMVWTDSGQTYYVRKEGKTEYWDDANGMPVWKIKGGRVDLLDLNRLLDFRGYGRHPSQIFISSKADSVRAKDLLTRPEGDFFRRRAESAAVTLTQEKDNQYLHFKAQGEDLAYVLGKDVQEQQIEGKTVKVRSYYQISSDPRDQSRNFMGVVMVDDQKQPLKDPSTGNVLNSSLFGYLPSQEQQFDFFSAMVSESQWITIAPAVERDRVQKELNAARSDTTHWQYGTDGHEHLVNDQKVEQWTRWQDDQGNQYYFDQRDPDAEKLYQIDKDGKLSIASSGLRGTEKVAALDSTVGQWLREPSAANTSPWTAPGSKLIKGGATDGFSIWVDIHGNVHARVPSASQNLGKITLAAGDWRFENGLKTVQNTLNSVTNAPFLSEIPMPSMIDPATFFDPSVDRRTVQTLPDGTVETAYYFQTVASQGDKRDFSGALIQRQHGPKGPVELFAVSASEDGLGYLKAARSNNALTLWSPRAMLPSELTNASGEKGVVPSLILAQLPQDERQGAEAHYFIDPETNEFYLRVQTSANAYVFHAERTAAGEAEVAKAIRGGGSKSAYIPLAPNPQMTQEEWDNRLKRKAFDPLSSAQKSAKRFDGKCFQTEGFRLGSNIPEKLIRQLPDYKPGVFVQDKNGQWSYAQSTLGSAKSYADLLATSGRYSQVLDARVSIKDFDDYFRSQGKPMKDSWGNEIPDGAATSNADSVTIYGGVAFHPYTNPGDPQPDAYTILEVAADGLFNDPEAPAGTPAVPVYKGQVVMVSAGSVEYIRERAELASGRNSAARDYGYITRSFESPEMMKHNPAKQVFETSHGTLSPYMGAGAQNITGTWYAVEEKSKGLPVTTWVFKADRDGTYRDAVTQKPVHVDAGSTWVLQNSDKMSADYLHLQTLDRPTWTRSLLPLSVVKPYYAGQARTRGFSSATLDDGKVFTLPGSNVSGHLVVSSVDDPEAPTYFVADASGRSSVFGNVKAGDVFVLQYPVRYLEKVQAAARDAQAVLYKPDGSVVGLRSDTFNSPLFSGLKQAQDVDPKALGVMPLPMGDKAVVQVGTNAKGETEIKGQLIAEPAMDRFLSRYAEGWGTLRVRDGSVSTSIDGRTVSLAGVVGLSEHPVAGRHPANPQEINIQWVFDHMQRDVDAEGHPKKGWVVVIDGKTIDVVFGVKSARYAIDHPGIDKGLKTDGVAAAIYYFDGNTPNKYQSMEEVKAFGSRVVPIIEISKGNWEPAFFDEIGGQWHLFGSDPANLSVLIPFKAPSVVQPLGADGKILRPDQMPHGVMELPSAGDIHSLPKLIAQLEFRPDLPKKLPTDQEHFVQTLLNDSESNSKIRDLAQRDYNRFLSIYPLLTENNVKLDLVTGHTILTKRLLPIVTQILKFPNDRSFDVFEVSDGQGLISRTSFDPSRQAYVEHTYDPSFTEFEMPLKEYTVTMNADGSQRRLALITEYQKYLGHADASGQYKTDGPLVVMLAKNILSGTLYKKAYDPKDLMGGTYWTDDDHQASITFQGKLPLRLHYSGLRIKRNSEDVNRLVTDKARSVLYGLLSKSRIVMPTFDATLSYNFMGADQINLREDEMSSAHRGVNIRPSSSDGKLLNQEAVKALSVDFDVRGKKGGEKFSVEFVSGSNNMQKSVVWTPPANFVSKEVKSVSIPLLPLIGSGQLDWENLREVRIHYGLDLHNGQMGNLPATDLDIANLEFNYGDKVRPFELMRGTPISLPEGLPTFFATETFPTKYPQDRTTFIYAHTEVKESLSSILEKGPEKGYEQLDSVRTTVGTDPNGFHYTRVFEPTTGSSFIEIRDASGRLSYRRDSITQTYDDKTFAYQDKSNSSRPFSKEIHAFTFYQLSAYDQENPGSGYSIAEVGRLFSQGEDSRLTSGHDWYVNNLFQQKELSNRWKVTFMQAVSLKSQGAADELPWQRPGQQMMVLIDPDGHVRYQSAWKGASNKYEESDKYFDARGLLVGSDDEVKAILDNFQHQLVPGPWPESYFDKNGHLKAQLVDHAIQQIPYSEYFGASAPAASPTYDGKIVYHPWVAAVYKMGSRANGVLIALFLGILARVFYKAAGFKTRLKKFLPDNKFGDRAPVILFNSRVLSASEIDEASQFQKTLVSDDSYRQKVKKSIKNYIEQIAEISNSEAADSSESMLQKRIRVELDGLVELIYGEYLRSLRQTPEYRYEGLAHSNLPGSDPNGLWINRNEAGYFYEPVHDPKWNALASDPTTHQDIPETGIIHTGTYQYPLNWFVWQSVIKRYVLQGVNGNSLVAQAVTRHAVSLLQEPRVGAPILETASNDVDVILNLWKHQVGKNDEIQGRGAFNPLLLRRLLLQTEGGYILQQGEFEDYLRYRMINAPEEANSLSEIPEVKNLVPLLITNVQAKNEDAMRARLSMLEWSSVSKIRSDFADRWDRFHPAPHGGIETTTYPSKRQQALRDLDLAMFNDDVFVDQFYQQFLKLPEQDQTENNWQQFLAQFIDGSVLKSSRWLSQLESKKERTDDQKKWEELKQAKLLDLASAVVSAKMEFLILRDFKDYLAIQRAKRHLAMPDSDWGLLKIAASVLQIFYPGNLKALKKSDIFSISLLSVILFSLTIHWIPVWGVLALLLAGSTIFLTSQSSRALTSNAAGRFLVICFLQTAAFYLNPVAGWLSLAALVMSSSFTFPIWHRFFRKSFHELHDTDKKQEMLLRTKENQNKWKIVGSLALTANSLILASTAPIWAKYPVYIAIPVILLMLTGIPLISHVAFVLVSNGRARSISEREKRFTVRTWSDASKNFTKIFDWQKDQLANTPQNKEMAWAYVMFLSDRFLESRLRKSEVIRYMSPDVPALARDIVFNPSPGISSWRDLSVAQQNAILKAVPRHLSSDPPSDLEVEQGFRLWINKFVREDRPPEPTSLADVDPMNVIIGAAEEPWDDTIRFLLEKQDKVQGVKKVRKDLSQMALGYPEAWQNFLLNFGDRFGRGNDTFIWLRDRIQDPESDVSSFFRTRPSPEMISAIESFARERSLNVRRTVRDALRVGDIAREYYDRLSVPIKGESQKAYKERREAWVKQHARVVLKYEGLSRAAQTSLMRLVYNKDSKKLYDDLYLPPSAISTEELNRYRRVLETVRTKDAFLMVESLYEPEDVVIRRFAVLGLTQQDAFYFMRHMSHLLKMINDAATVYEYNIQDPSIPIENWGREDLWKRDAGLITNEAAGNAQKVALRKVQVSSDPLRYTLGVIGFAREHRDEGLLQLVFAADRPEQIAAAKFYQIAFALPKFLPGGTIWALDALMSFQRQDIRDTARLQQRFHNNPTLGFLHAAQGASNEWYSSNTHYSSVGEEIWAGPGLRATSASTFWRATLYTYDAFVDRGMLVGAYAVAEDTDGNVRLKLQGLQNRLEESLLITQGQIAYHHITSNKRIRYAQSSVRLLLENMFRDALFNPNISFDDILDEVIGLIFFLRKPLVLIMIVGQILTNVTFPFMSVYPMLVMPLIPFAVLTASMVGYIVFILGASRKAALISTAVIGVALTGLLLLTSIGGMTIGFILLPVASLPFLFLGLLFAEDKIFLTLLQYTEDDGVRKGLFNFIQEFPSLLMTYLGVIPQDYAGGAIKGSHGSAVFVRAIRTAAVVNVAFKNLYVRNRFALGIGVLLNASIVFGLAMNSYPWVLATSSAFILAAISFVASFFVLNEYKDKSSKMFFAALGVLQTFAASASDFALSLWNWLKYPFLSESTYHELNIRTAKDMLRMRLMDFMEEQDSPIRREAILLYLSENPEAARQVLSDRSEAAGVAENNIIEHLIGEIEQPNYKFGIKDFSLLAKNKDFELAEKDLSNLSDDKIFDLYVAKIYQDRRYLSRFHTPQLEREYRLLRKLNTNQYWRMGFESGKFKARAFRIVCAIFVILAPVLSLLIENPSLIMGSNLSFHSIFTANIGAISMAKIFLIGHPASTLLLSFVFSYLVAGIAVPVIVMVGIGVPMILRWVWQTISRNGSNDSDHSRSHTNRWLNSADPIGSKFFQRSQWLAQSVSRNDFGPELLHEYRSNFEEYVEEDGQTPSRSSSAFINLLGQIDHQFSRGVPEKNTASRWIKALSEILSMASEDKNEQVQLIGGSLLNDLYRYRGSLLELNPEFSDRPRIWNTVYARLAAIVVGLSIFVSSLLAQSPVDPYPKFTRFVWYSFSLLIASGLAIGVGYVVRRYVTEFKARRIYSDWGRHFISATNRSRSQTNFLTWWDDMDSDGHLTTNAAVRIYDLLRTKHKLSHRNAIKVLYLITPYIPVLRNEVTGGVEYENPEEGRVYLHGFSENTPDAKWMEYVEILIGRSPRVSLQGKSDAEKTASFLSSINWTPTTSANQISQDSHMGRSHNYQRAPYPPEWHKDIIDLEEPDKTIAKWNNRALLRIPDDDLIFKQAWEAPNHLGIPVDHPMFSQFRSETDISDVSTKNELLVLGGLVLSFVSLAGVLPLMVGVVGAASTFVLLVIIGAKRWGNTVAPPKIYKPLKYSA